MYIGPAQAQAAANCNMGRGGHGVPCQAATGSSWEGEAVFKAVAPAKPTLCRVRLNIQQYIDSTAGLEGRI